MSRFFTRIINYVFYFLIALFLFVNAVKFSEYVGFGILEYILPVVIFIGVFFLFRYGTKLHGLLTKVCTFSERLERYSAAQLGIILFGFVSVTKIILVFLLDTDVGAYADMPNYMTFATQFAETGMITHNTIYASRYEYTVVFGWFLSPVVKLFGSDPKVFTSFMSILYAVITVILFDIIRPYAGNKRSFVGLLVYHVTPVGLFISQVLVHETALLFFYALSLWLFLKAIHSNLNILARSISLLLSALLIGFGTTINKGGIVVIISYVIYAVILLFKNKPSIKNSLNVLALACCYMLCLVMMSRTTNAFVSSHIVYPSEENRLYCEHASESSVSFGWPIYLGTNTEERGQFNDLDYETYNRFLDISDTQEAIDYQKNLISERLQVFIDDPLQIPVHLYFKFKKLYARPFVAIEYCRDNNLFPILKENLGGYPMTGLRSLGNIYSMLLAAIILFSYRKHKKETYENYLNPGLQFELFFIGLTLALLPFEIAQKYVCHMPIILTCIAILCFPDFLDNSGAIKGARKQTP